MRSSILRNPWLYAVVFVGLAVVLSSSMRQPQLSVGVAADPNTGRAPGTWKSVEEVRAGYADSQAAGPVEDGSDAQAPDSMLAAASTDVDDASSEQRIEDLVQSRVARATAAVLGSPRPAVKKPARVVEPAAEEVIAAAEPEVVPPVGMEEAGQLAAVALVVPVSRAEPEPEPEPAPEPAPEVVPQPAPEPELVVAAAGISDTELEQLLADFVDYYEAGDAAGFATLFSRDAQTTDANGRREIKRVYESFFAETVVESVSFKSARWQALRGETRTGTTQARIVTTPAAGGKTTVVEVSIQFEVLRAGGKALQISRMTY